MQYAAMEWVYYLEGAGGALGALLVGAGLSLILSGWRSARVSLVVVYTLTGVMVGGVIHESSGPSSIGALAACLIGGVIGGAVGGLLKQYATMALAGILGTLTLWAVLAPSALPPVTIYILLALMFAAVVAGAHLYKRTTTIVLTSFAGSVLLVSGTVSLVGMSRDFLPHFREMATYDIFFPAMLLVPTVSGTLLQLGAAASKDAGDIHK